MVLLGDVEKLQQLVPLVDRTHFLPEHEVEDEAEGEGHGKGDEHEGVGDPDGGGPNEEAVTGAHRLGHDLPEDDDAQGRHGDGDSPRHDVVQENGDRAVHSHVAEEDGAEKVVAVLADAIYESGAQLLPARAALHDDLEGGGVEGHQAEVEPGEEGGEAEENEEEDDLQGEGEEGRRRAGIGDSKRLPGRVSLMHAVEAEVKRCARRDSVYGYGELRIFVGWAPRQRYYGLCNEGAVTRCVVLPR